MIRDNIVLNSWEPGRHGDGIGRTNNRLASRGRGSLQPEKGLPLDKYMLDDGLLNIQMDKTKKISVWALSPEKKAGKLVKFWAAKPALRNGTDQQIFSW